MLARSCNFEDVDARKYQDEVVLGSFIRGIQESTIRQRLLESKTLTFNKTVSNAEM